MCPDFGTPKTINFPFGTNGKFIILGVPILKHITVIAYFPNCLPSSIVSGNSLCSVSGNKRANTPAATDAAPNITNGNALPKSPLTTLF